MKSEASVNGNATGHSREAYWASSIMEDHFSLGDSKAEAPHWGFVREGKEG